MQQLMTEELAKTAPRLYEQDGAEDPTVYAHYFSCVNGWDWWLLEFDGTDEAFGLVEGYDDELGYFSIKEMAELNRQMTVDFGQPFPFENQWKVPLNTSDCASVLLTAYQFTGGANGQEKMATFTWNKLTDSLMPLNQLLPLVLKQPNLESLATICREELTVALAAQNDANLQSMIQAGTEPVPENYDLFTISDKGLTIYFEKYQVAPGSQGSQAVLIPYLK